MRQIIYKNTYKDYCLENKIKHRTSDRGDVYIPSNFRHIRINPIVLSYLQSHDKLKLYSSYLKLKSEYKNSCIFDATGSRVAQVLNCSRQTGDRIKKNLIKEGWAKMHGDNLILCKTNHITEEYRSYDRLKFSKKARLYLKCNNKSTKEILIYLQYLIFKQKEVNRSYLLKLCQDLNTGKTTKECKDADRKARKYNLVDKKGETDERLQISYRGIAKMFRCSVGKAYSMIKSFTKNHMVHVTRKQELILSRVPMDFWEDNKKSFPKCHYAYGNIVRNHCNKYNLLS